MKADEPDPIREERGGIMKRITIRAGAVALLAVILLGSSPAFGAVITLRAMFFSNVAGSAPYNVRIELNEFTPPEEALKLVGLMSKGDQDGFYAMLRGLNKGRMLFTGSNNMQFQGGLGTNVKFNIAQEYETEKGIQIVLVTEGRAIEPGTTKLLNVPWRFLLVILDLDKNYKGSGKIYEDAAIGATPMGNITLASSFSISRELMNVRIQK
jgi:hypothetical protein